LSIFMGFFPSFLQGLGSPTLPMVSLSTLCTIRGLVLLERCYIAPCVANRLVLSTSDTVSPSGSRVLNLLPFCPPLIGRVSVVVWVSGGIRIPRNMGHKTAYGDEGSLLLVPSEPWQLWVDVSL
jgi:hypothetical protein